MVLLKVLHLIQDIVQDFVRHRKEVRIDSEYCVIFLMGRIYRKEIHEAKKRDQDLHSEEELAVRDSFKVGHVDKRATH